MIKKRPSQLHTFLVLGRVSNLPTIWTNILAASLFAIAVGTPTEFLDLTKLISQQIDINSAVEIIDKRINTALDNWIIHWLFIAFGLVVGLSCLYLGGMFLNDACDAEWDRQHKVARPISLGHIDSHSVYLWSVSLLGIGICLLGVFSFAQLTSIASLVASSLLLFAIIAYNLLHKAMVWSRFLMGLCRTGVYLVSALFMGSLTVEIIWVAVVFGLYISGVTLLAQFESTPQAFEKNKNSQWCLLAFLLLAAPLSLIGLMPLNGLFIATLAGFYAVLTTKLWPTFKCIIPVSFVVFSFIPPAQAHSTQGQNISINPRQIGALLGAIPLFDAVVLASVEQWIPSLLCVGLYLVLPSLHRWISPT